MNLHVDKVRLNPWSDSEPNSNRDRRAPGYHATATLSNFAPATPAVQNRFVAGKNNLWKTLEKGNKF